LKALRLLFCCSTHRIAATTEPPLPGLGLSATATAGSLQVSQPGKELRRRVLKSQKRNS
jgi:hypothetical protein